MSLTRIFFVPHTHWDREWYYTFEVFREKLIQLIDHLTGILKRDPSWKYFLLDGQTIVLEDYLEIKGDAPELLKLVKDGRIGIGPWYDLPDEFLVSGESIIRNLKLGFALCHKFGVKPVQVGYLPDMFGHISQMPQIFRGFGLENTIVWRGVPDLGRNQFHWQSRDQSEVFAAFLPTGYGLFSDLPENAPEFVKRLDIILGLLKMKDQSGVYLVMFGNDHLFPDSRLATMLKQSGAISRDWDLKLGRLEDYFAEIKQAGQELPAFSGELRSNDQTQILPGVASTRLYLKKMNHDADTMLCKYLEPVSSLAWLACGEDIRSRLDYLWKLLLQNHPHDSICGCSIDPVHKEMETRFQKFFALADFLLNRSLARLTDIQAPNSDRLTVWNPYAASGYGIIEFDDEFFGKTGLALEDEQGKKYPLEKVERLAKADLLYQAQAPAAFSFLPLAWFNVEQIFGLYINEIKTRKQGGQLLVDFFLSSKFLNFPIREKIARLQEQIEKEKVKTILFRIFRKAKFKTIAVVDELKPASLTCFKVKNEKFESRSEIMASERGLENQWLKLAAEADGRLVILDKTSGREIEMGFSDRGDRGDEYNFDPVPDEEPLTRPEKFRVRPGPCGRNFATLELAHLFKVPAELDATRARRSSKKTALSLQTRVLFYAGVRRVDFETRFVNTAKDHRLQADFWLPGLADHYWAESGFDLVPRKIVQEKPAEPPQGLDLAKLILGCESAYASGPIQNFAGLESNGAGFLLAARGLKEVESEKQESAGRSRLSLTLCRSVGSIARPDLKFRTGLAGPPTATPDAQCLREFNWSYSLIPFTGAITQATLFSQAYHFVFPPLAFPGKPRVKMPFAIRGSQIILSALYRGPGRSLIARFFNPGFRQEKLELELSPEVASVSALDLKEQVVARPGLEKSDSRLQTTLRPAEILTLVFELGNKEG